MRPRNERRYDRYRDAGLHIKRDNLPGFHRRRAERQYAWRMQPERGKAKAQKRFAEWVQDVVNAYAEPPRKWSMSRLARESGVHRNNLYGWINMTAYPQAATVRRFCERLGLTYAEPARILGWSEAPQGERHRDLEGFIRRAKAEVAHPKTTEQRRRELQERIDDAEATQRMLRRAEDLLREALNEDQPES